MVRNIAPSPRSTLYILNNHLGFERGALVINGHTPGPELHLVQGDAVEVGESKVHIPINVHHRV
jgi:hypothetical protein